MNLPPRPMKKASPFWSCSRPVEPRLPGALTGEASDAVRIDQFRARSTSVLQDQMCGSLLFGVLAYSRARLGQFDDAWRCIDDAVPVEAPKERWYEAELQRSAGTIALKRARAGCR